MTQLDLTIDVSLHDTVDEFWHNRWWYQGSQYYFLALSIGHKIKKFLIILTFPSYALSKKKWSCHCIWKCIFLHRFCKIWSTVLTCLTPQNPWKSTEDGWTELWKSFSDKETENVKKLWKSHRCVTDTMQLLKNHK